VPRGHSSSQGHRRGRLDRDHGLDGVVAGFRNLGEYVSAKHGVVGLMKGLALELGLLGVRVNVVSPTQVDPAMIQHEAYYRLFCPGHPAPGEDEMAAASQTKHVVPTPWCDVRDSSNTIAFLVSEEGRFITGQNVGVDAGALLL
jgi:(+)-trans-carveol dehydrogenase